MRRRDAALVAAFLSAGAFALSFVLMAAFGVAFFSGGNPLSALLELPGVVAAFLIVGAPIAFLLFFVGALLPGWAFYSGLRAIGCANPWTAAVTCMGASVAASWPLLGGATGFMVPSAVSGALAGVIFEREMRRRLRPRPARLS